MHHKGTETLSAIKGNRALYDKSMKLNPAH